MALFEQFPYINFHEQNDDWMLKQIKHLESKFEKIDESPLAPVPKYFTDVKFEQ